MLDLSGYVKALALSAFLIALLWAHEAYSIMTVPDAAGYMEPAVRRGSVRLLSSDPTPPRRGTIVAFESGAFRSRNATESRAFFSRCVGVAGDRIALRDGRLERNGRAVHESYALRSVAGEDMDEVVVPAGCMFVLNDARDDAASAFQDSRRLGPVPVSAVIGKIADANVEKQAEEE
jgi:signal peptidase I